MILFPNPLDLKKLDIFDKATTVAVVTVSMMTKMKERFNFMQ
ncbi:hypothetical protein OQG81_03530 [Streptococcus macedonicus]|uniref:Uncharacterized protein n=1 Tax=Streptococcus macedonicus TaxID=59310 RepID=A0AA47FDE1_STRMC|nr:hypothetical protein [Streptococcus macedonicus]WAK63933.1 hypothetical protein OQG81_03530 [Streptococcus macedonicus]